MCLNSILPSQAFPVKTVSYYFRFYIIVLFIYLFYFSRTRQGSEVKQQWTTVALEIFRVCLDLHTKSYRSIRALCSGIQNTTHTKKEEIEFIQGLSKADELVLRLFPFPNYASFLYICML